MKHTLKWISYLAILALIILGCSGSDDGSVSTNSGSGTETSFNFTLTSLKKQETAAGKMASFTADQVMTGQLQATNTDTSAVQTFDWSIYFDEDTFAAQSNKTIILTPGTYEFALLLVKGDQQYAGSVAGVSISDGTFDVPMTVRPIIGDTITDVNLVASLAEFKFQYYPAELAAASLVNPQMGIMVNGGAEAIYGINPASGISDTWINLDEGAGTLQLKLYDGSLQVGRSITAQESVIVSAGLNITMDLVALHGETTFALTEAGGDATFSFNIPSEVVDEAGGLGNLQVLFSLVGPNNPLDENLLTLTSNGAGGASASITLSNKQFDNVTVSLAFTDTSVSELLGSCSIAANLDTTERTLNCDVTLRRRAIIGGSLLATLGINVFNEAGEPVAGAVISESGNILGITGSGAFGTEGYLKVYLNAGDYTIKAEGSEKYGEDPITLVPLGSNNLDIELSIPFITAGDSFNYIAGTVPFTMVYVPGGLTFPTGIDDLGAPATVANAFLIGQTEVTYELWYAVNTWATLNGYTFANAGVQGNSGGGTNQHPVTTINWRDSMVWMNALTEYYNGQNGTNLTCAYYSDAGYTTPIRDSSDGIYGASVNPAAGGFDDPYVKSDATGFRLLTSNETELAARYITDDGDKTLDKAGEYYPGNYASGATAERWDTTATGLVAVYSSNSGLTTATVASKLPNALGLFDISGNVHEWGFDLIGTYNRVYRGGGYMSSSTHLQVGNLYSTTPWFKTASQGFRFAKAP